MWFVARARLPRHHALRRPPFVPALGAVGRQPRALEPCANGAVQSSTRSRRTEYLIVNLSLSVDSFHMLNVQDLECPVCNAPFKLMEGYLLSLFPRSDLGLHEPRILMCGACASDVYRVLGSYHLPSQVVAD